MGFLSAYNENVRVSYISEALSRATFFNLIVFLIVIVCPYLIAYRSQGFWNKIDHVREQPIVNFKHELLFILELTTNDAEASSKTLVSTTIDSLNQLMDTKASRFIASRQADGNLDGIFESLELQVTIPIGQNFRLRSFHVFLLFDYKLVKHVALHMESLAYTYFQASGTSNKFNLFADLALMYKTPLWNHVRDERYNKEVIPRKADCVEEYDIAKILLVYASRNVSTILKNKYEFMEENSDLAVGDVMFNIHIAYPEVAFEQWAGLWNTLKWAWIQYLAVFVVIFALMRKFQRLAYDSKMFDVRKEVPWETKLGERSVISNHSKSN